MQSVKDIRSNQIVITNKPILYTWWFKTICLPQLFELLHTEIDFDKLLTKLFDNESYALLDIGWARIGHCTVVEYNMLDLRNYHERGLEMGTLAMLRKVLCGLLQLPMTKSRAKVNDFMDENIAVEYQEYELEMLESLLDSKTELYYLPLRYYRNKNTNFSESHRNILKHCIDRMRC